MKKRKKLLILGDSAFAQVAYECFTCDSDYEVVGFSVEQKYMKQDNLFGLPVVPFENVEKYYSVDDVHFYAAFVYSQLNRLRTRFFNAAKEKGYRPASYVSSRAFVWRDANIGEHCFIFEDNTIQPFVSIGKNVVVWSGNHIGHHSEIEDNCFIASHAVISGFCIIGENSFVGVNATLGNNVTIGKDNWIGLGATIVHSTKDNSLYKGERSNPDAIPAKEFFKVGGH